MVGEGLEDGAEPGGVLHEVCGCGTEEAAVAVGAVEVRTLYLFLSVVINMIDEQTFHTKSMIGSGKCVLHDNIYTLLITAVIGIGF